MRYFRVTFTLLCLLALSWAQAQQQPAPAAPAGVTLVLAGGGAKGFAHLAVLRRLEREQIPIAKIIGTSIGAVIGGLYASGMSTQAIEQLISTVEPGKVALDQLDRTELSHRARAYQQQYPVDIELGVKNGQLTFARGVSDGQRMLTLLQQLTASVPPSGRFDDLKIPFRAVATRFRDGELVAFDHGMLALAIRASMAAPGVFAPVEIEGETYVDGGLVANLPVEIALREDPGNTIVASYLGDTDRPGDTQETTNALGIANQMLTILMRQNERRNLALLRAQDIVVRPQLQNFSFGSFGNAAEIIRAGEAAVAALDARFEDLSRSLPRTTPLPQARQAAYTQREISIGRVRVTGNHAVPQEYVQTQLSPLLGQAFDPAAVAQRIDDLYTTGYFERITYQMLQLRADQYELVVDVNEKTYGPNFLRTSLGLYTESSGTNLYSVGLGYRRPWLTSDGLELNLDVRVGSQMELAASAFQPLGSGWGLLAHADYNTSELPLYRSDIATAQKVAISTLRRQSMGLDLSYDFNKKATGRIGLVTNQTRIGIDTSRTVTVPAPGGGTSSYELQDGQWEYTGMNLQFLADLLDSPSFPTQGYYVNAQAAQGVTGPNEYASYRLNALMAHSFGPHVFNLGLDMGSDYIFNCDGCSRPTSLAPLYLGGFQAMGAYQLGQLNGDRLVHLQSTYMYRLSDGGILRQPTYVGLVAEVGDAWLHTGNPLTKYSVTGFVAIDSKIGDIFVGIAGGSSGNRNVFLQLGRRFSFW
jgi:NTE family protein